MENSGNKFAEVFMPKFVELGILDEWARLVRHGKSAYQLGDVIDGLRTSGDPEAENAQKLFIVFGQSRSWLEAAPTFVEASTPAQAKALQSEHAQKFYDDMITLLCKSSQAAIERFLNTNSHDGPIMEAVRSMQENVSKAVTDSLGKISDDIKGLADEAKEEMNEGEDWKRGQKD